MAAAALAASLAACPGKHAVPDGGSSDCATRSGGAFVRFGICGVSGALTIWSTRAAFVDEAERLLATGQQRIPTLDLRDGVDCDSRWSWHVDPATPGWADSTIELCDGCPSDVEENKAYWIGTVQQYCPWSALVEAVERRP